MHARAVGRDTDAGLNSTSEIRLRISAFSFLLGLSVDLSSSLEKRRSVRKVKTAPVLDNYTPGCAGSISNTCEIRRVQRGLNEVSEEGEKVQRKSSPFQLLYSSRPPGAQPCRSR